jgi:predicted DNA-binding transcriptional regulator YafY
MLSVKEVRVEGDFVDAPSDRASARRDRTARLNRVMGLLQGNPGGLTPQELARRLGMSVRTVYRDLRAIDDELAPTWSDGGKWGIDAEKAFLPPLKLTLSEAMAVVLSARLLVRYADKYNPALASAFEKLEAGLSPSLKEHVERTLAALSAAPRDEHFNTVVDKLTRAWAERRVVAIDYEPAAYDHGARRRRAEVRPYLIEPSLQTHALYLIGFDETRGALRTFKIERIRDAALTPRTFEAPEPEAADATAAALRRAWDIIADQPPVDVVLRFAPGVAGRVGETTWHPSQRLEPQADGSLVWRATVAGTIEIRIWILGWGDDVDVVAPASLRDDVRATLKRALARYTG